MGNEVSLSMLRDMAAKSGMSVAEYAQRNGYDLAAMKLQEAKLGGEAPKPADEAVFTGKKFNVTINGNQYELVCKGNELAEGSLKVLDSVLKDLPGVNGFFVEDGKLFAKHNDGNSYPVSALVETGNAAAAKPKEPLNPAIKLLFDRFGAKEMAKYTDINAAEKNIKEQIAAATDAYDKAEASGDAVNAAFIKNQLSGLYKTQKLLAEIRTEKNPGVRDAKVAEYITTAKVDFDENPAQAQEASVGKAIRSVFTVGLVAVAAAMLLSSCNDTTNVGAQQSQVATIPQQKQRDYSALLDKIYDRLGSMEGRLTNIEQQFNNDFKNIVNGLNTLVQQGQVTQEMLEAQFDKIDAFLNAILEQGVAIQTSNNKNASEILKVLNNIRSSELSDLDKLDELIALVTQIKTIGESIDAKLTKLLGISEETIEKVRNIDKNGEQSNKLLNAIYNAITKLGDDFDGYFNSMLLAVIENSAKIDDLNKLLVIINNNVVNGNEQQKADAKKFLAELQKLNYTVTGGMDAILEAILKGNVKLDEIINLLRNNDKGVKALLNQVIANQQTMIKDNKAGFVAVIEAIGKVSVNPLDLSKIQELLEAIKTGVNDNGKLLKKITEQNDTVINILNAFKSEVGTRMKGLDAWLEKIYNKIPAGGTGGCKVDFDALMAKLNEILEAIKKLPTTDEITVNISGEVTCKCNCGGGTHHEGIIGNLDDLLG